MTLKEIQGRGLLIHDSNHKMTKRSQSHDYSEKGLYMLTLVIRGRGNLFGKLITKPYPKIEHSQLGMNIIENELRKIPMVYPMVRVWDYCLMPDHLHMIVRVDEHLPDKKHLGHVVRGFKSGCNNAYWELHGDRGNGLYEKGYNDRILYKEAQLVHWKRYIEDNPRRLAMKKEHPDLFTVIHNQIIVDRHCQMVGNRFLLDIPDKMAVIVHRADNIDTFTEKYKQWMACGERGGVLVSAAVSEIERAVMHEAMERDYNVIWLRDNGFKPLYKPVGRSFDACLKGQLLEISPWEYVYGKKRITRQECLLLNALAEDICRLSTESIGTLMA